METIDPTTGRPLPADAIQRILFISPSVHVYQIPPQASNKGHMASAWTSKHQIFTARLRILETAVPSTTGEVLKTDILLEDPSSGQLFAAAPYTQESAVEQVLDSSRFFAVRVQGEGGRKAVLGVGFEERSDAFDFSVALQEVRRSLGLEGKPPPGKKGPRDEKKEDVKQDFSLKEGETITVNLGSRRRIKADERNKENGGETLGGGLSLPPPPGGNTFLPPPPSASEIKKQKRLSATFEPPDPKEDVSAEDLGFDDGEFGEFQ